MQVDDLLGAIWLPGDGKVNPTDLTQSLAKGARQRGARIVERVRVTGFDVERRGRRVTGVRTDRGDVEAEVVVNCAGQWAKALGDLVGVTVPLHSAEHFYVVTEAIDGRPPRPADHARPGRLDLLQGGDRRSRGRRLRARGQAVALAGRPALPLRVPAARRGLGALLGAHGPGAAPDPGAGGDRHPEVLQRPGVVHAGQPVPAGRGARARRLLRRRRLQLGRHRLRRRRGPRPGRVDRGGGAAGRPGRASTYAGSRRSTPTTGGCATGSPRCSGCTTPCPGPTASSRPAAPQRLSPLHDRLAGRGCGVRHPDGLGAAATSSAAAARSTTPGASRPGCRGRPPSSAPCRRRSRSSTRPRSPSTSSTGPTRSTRCSGSAPPTSTCRSGSCVYTPVPQRARHLRGRPDGHPRPAPRVPSGRPARRRPCATSTGWRRHGGVARRDVTDGVRRARRDGSAVAGRCSAGSRRRPGRGRVPVRHQPEVALAGVDGPRDPDDVRRRARLGADGPGRPAARRLRRAARPAGAVGRGLLRDRVAAAGEGLPRLRPRADARPHAGRGGAGLRHGSEGREGLPGPGSARGAPGPRWPGGPRRRVVSLVVESPEPMLWGGELVLRDGVPVGQVTSAAWGETRRLLRRAWRCLRTDGPVHRGLAPGAGSRWTWRASGTPYASRCGRRWPEAPPATSGSSGQHQRAVDAVPGVMRLMRTFAAAGIAKSSGTSRANPRTALASRRRSTR